MEPDEGRPARSHSLRWEWLVLVVALILAAGVAYIIISDDPASSFSSTIVDVN